MFFMTGSSNRGPIDDFWYLPIQFDHRHGRVSADMARQIAIVYACINVRSQTLAQLPIFLYRRRADGGKERVTDHPASKLIRQHPNAWQSSYKFREMMQAHLDLRGNAYALKEFSPNGDILSLTPLHPDRVKPQRIVGTMALKYIYTDMDAEEHTYRQSEIMHLRGPTDDGLIGLSPIEVERIAFSDALTTQDFGRRFYQNDASAGGWIEYPGKFESREAKKSFREQWQESQTGHNRGKTIILDQGLKYHELGIKATDAQFLETRKYHDTDIARIYRVPPHKVGILDRATNNNIEQQALEFITDTMMPVFVNWEEEMSINLLNEDDQDEYFFEVMVDGLLRGDSTARANYFNKAITTGWMTRNEARILENQNPLPGLDEPLVMLNMQPADPDLQQAAEPADPAADIQEESAAAADEPDAEDEKSLRRAAALERQTAGFLVRKEIQNCRGIYGRPDKSVIEGALQAFYADHEALITRALVVDPIIAAAYVAESKAELFLALGDPLAYKTVLDRWSHYRVQELIAKAHAHG